MNGPKPSTDSAWARILALRASIVGLPRLFPALLRHAVAFPVAAMLALVILSFAWSCERLARLRQSLQADQVKAQATTDISRLQAHAASALREANQQHAQAIRQLESTHQKLQREAEGLRERLKSLHQQELARVDAVATLPTDEVASRVATRLGSDAMSAVDSSRKEHLASFPPPAAPPSAIGGTPETRRLTPGTSQSSNLEARSAAPVLSLSDSGARKMETAFIQLDSCRQQVQVLDQQTANCQQQAGITAKVITEQGISITSLNSALADKDQILARRETQSRAELKAARGTWRSRFFRAVEYFTAGMALGAALR
jgi:hypothetical protein